MGCFTIWSKKFDYWIDETVETTVNVEQPEIIEQPEETDHSDYTESSFEINIDKYVDADTEPEPEEEQIFEPTATAETA